MSIQHQMNLRSWTLLVILSLLWGGSFFFIGVAVGHLPALTIVFLRVAMAAVFLWAVVLVMRLTVPWRREVWQAFLGMCVLNNVLPFCLIVYGQSQIASGVASILNATTPLFGVVIAHVLTPDEKLTPARFGGVIAGFLGVSVMMGGNLLAGGQGIWGVVAVLGAAFCYGLSGVFGRRFARLGVNPVVTATGQVSCSTAVLLPLMLVVDRPWQLHMPGGDVILALVGLAILSTGLAYIIFYKVLAVAGATNLLLVTFLIPVSAILLGVAFLGEVLEPRHLLGMAFIGAGLAAIDGRVLTRLRRPVGAE
ncbi:DMT family transporter [Algicella marina]|uniref:EamA family transporter n=1 Tax=Algicella marina TaxID=2683284 RepID=A0A6P1SUF5_9RHOB|nr:DMT family transporter [Algicella marina]QHQ34068.1 EamA family transporter [Algicella marina]